MNVTYNLSKNEPTTTEAAQWTGVDCQAPNYDSGIAIGVITPDAE